jgi:predicted ATP-grasp superfamily ATP-dependent carboligase
MKILVFEYITGGGLFDAPISPSLAREGEWMQQALLRDLADLPEIEVWTLRDGRLPLPENFPPAIHWIVLTPGESFEPHFRKQLELCDAVWLIAPETDGILERLCMDVEVRGKILLTNASPAVKIAASKLETIRRLARHGIPIVPTSLLSEVRTPDFPVVIKPVDGIGGEGSRIIENLAQWKSALAAAPASRTVVQPLIAGEPLSLSVMFAHGQVLWLSGNRQEIERQDGFVLRACHVNAIRETAPYRVFVENIAMAIPELWGYAGIDLIQSTQGLQVLEINPRLTTSYVGLREARGINLASLILHLKHSGSLPQIQPTVEKTVEIRLESLT